MMEQEPLPDNTPSHHYEPQAQAVMPNTGVQAARDYLLEQQEKWRAYRERRLSEGNQDTAVADRMDFLCSILMQMVNEKASVDFNQSGILGEMLRRLSYKIDLDAPDDIADVGLLALQMATYINSCQT